MRSLLDRAEAHIFCFLAPRQVGNHIAFAQTKEAADDRLED